MTILTAAQANGSATLALTAVVCTTLTALAGLGLNYLLAVKRENEQIRKLRHDQLVESYTGVGRTMSAASSVLLQMAAALRDPEGGDDLARLAKQLNDDPELQQTRHLLGLLSMHDADDEVLAEFHDWRDWHRDLLGEGFYTEERIAGVREKFADPEVRWQEGKRLALEGTDKANAYYAAAGKHARSVLKG